METIRTFGIGLGSVMLAAGVSSPALGAVNAHGAELVFFGILLIASVLFADVQEERR